MNLLRIQGKITGDNKWFNDKTKEYEEATTKIGIIKYPQFYIYILMS